MRPVALMSVLVSELRQKEHVLTMCSDRLGIAVELVAQVPEEVIITCIIGLSGDRSVASSSGCLTSAVAPKVAEIDVSDSWLCYLVVHSRMYLCR